MPISSGCYILMAGNSRLWSENHKSMKNANEGLRPRSPRGEKPGCTFSSRGAIHEGEAGCHSEVENCRAYIRIYVYAGAAVAQEVVWAR